MLQQTLLALSVVLSGVLSQDFDTSCQSSSCYPATGDLLVGREDRLYSSSTCGLFRPRRYCIVSYLEQDKCSWCDSRRKNSTYSHEVESVASTFKNRRKWWQAENGVENVYIQLDFEAEFHFTHLIMTFKTFRPAAMMIERSYDFGKTWKVYRYFAYDCRDSFPNVKRGPIRKVTDVICESRYSQVAPSTDGEVIFRVLPPSITIDDPYSEEIQDLLKMTNLRVNFTKLHTLGDNLLDNRPEIKEKYYYAMYDMVVRGSCSCYGHASRCLPLPGFEAKTDMVHGRCECTHNTKGLNCEECADFYNDLPWRPARGRETNACRKCMCNNHATRCHFDASVYELSGRVSGGVCDDCQHNTMGHHCEECKPYFYQQPGKQLIDPDICAACDCDPTGSEHNGECESRTDRALGLVAGRCICKPHVVGRRCDTCQDGYWNLRADNPNGCEACSCNTLGTLGNTGCDKTSGECTCKRFVTGRNCNQCMPEYWGLSSDTDGCKACDCNPGGSYDNKCDAATGQCNCKPNILGRQCEQPRPGYFITNLDYLTYEGEFGEGTGNSRVVIREPVRGRPPTWTGPGFMRVSEGETLEIKVDNIPMSMEYDIVIRFEPQMPERWHDVRVTVVRPGEVDQTGPCANIIPSDDSKATSLPPSSRFYVVTPSSCLEKGVTYTIKLDFNRYKSGISTPEASVLIDSIVLLPLTDRMPFYHGEGAPEKLKEEFDYYRCRELQLSVIRSELPEVCRKHIFSISATMQEGALDCQCDPTGSVSSVCSTLGGQCQCKQNVIGRRCDQCAPGFYGFGPSGCLPCNCDAQGARDNFCDDTTGQCLCKPKNFGRQCNECQRGYWNFPNCQACQCNGHAEVCDNLTGRCIGCRDNTGGDRCERCVLGYYGDPRLGVNLRCRKCMCPGGAGSGYQHADTCSLDPISRNVVCDCRPGYADDDCSRCADNHFGNPLVSGGSCESCVCNNNIDTDVPGSCDASTGECLKCLYNSEGFSCERCRKGYFGDATQQNCQACVCNLLGTDRLVGACDIQTGQCPCLPNVVGISCDRCAPNHWKIASGQGCESCGCDPDGSLSQQCNEFDGQCVCKPGRGGRTCSECEANYWGDPNVQCRSCGCHSEGSQSLQCDRKTGECVCMPGVTGRHCDRCDRGTTGALPHCKPCGECFDNWDRIIADLRKQTNVLIEEAKNIKTGGAPGAFEKEFTEMEGKLDQVKDIIANANVTTDDLVDLRSLLAQIRKNLTDNSDTLSGIDKDLDDTVNRVDIADKRIEDIRARVDELKKAAEQLKGNATDIRESDVEGAFNSTKESQRRSQAAQAKVDNTAAIVTESEQTRTAAEDLIKNSQDEFDRKYEENEKNLKNVDGEIEKLDDKLVDLNEQVCDGRGDPCDALCGGAGCDKCGGLSCSDGAVTKANNALDLAKQAETIIKEKGAAAMELLTKMEAAQGTADMAKDDAQMAYDRALEARNISRSSRADLEELLEKIKDFLLAEGAKPSEIRKLAEETLAMRISLTPDQIRELAQKINETIKGLTNIDAILNATKADVDKAQRLKTRADNAKGAADNILNTAENVIAALEKAKEAQDAAQVAIDQADKDAKDADGDITMIEATTDMALKTAQDSVGAVDDLKTELDTVKKKFKENENKVSRASQAAYLAEQLANQADKNATDLEGKYNQVTMDLDKKYEETQTGKSRAQDLRDRARKLYQETFEKLNNLKKMETEFGNNEKVLIDLNDQIRQMNLQMARYLKDIIAVFEHHRTCVS